MYLLCVCPSLSLSLSLSVRQHTANTKPRALLLFRVVAKLTGAEPAAPRS